MPKSFQFYKQLDAMDCGAACLRMIARHYGCFHSQKKLREDMYQDRDGVSLLGISDTAENIGMRSLGVKIDYTRLIDDIPLPCIAHWQQEHFIVVYKANANHVWIADPASGKFKITKKEFLDGWIGPQQNENAMGVLLLLETTPSFCEKDGEEKDKTGFRYLFSYLKNYKQLIFQLIVGLGMVSVIQLIFPFLMQAAVDIGIGNVNLSFIYLILAAQLFLFMGQISVEFFRGWVLLHIGTRVNINLISDFLIKMMKLPARFFDTKQTGDILQRIYDNQRVEQFLTTTPLITFFSLFNLIIFGGVLLFFSLKIFMVFLLGTLIYVVWLLIFWKKRKELDYRRYDQLAKNQSTLIHLINGIQEIKLNNAETLKRWEWEDIQAKLYRVNMKYLSVDKWQRSGASLINESKNIFISFFAAMAVINGSLTLGQMFAIQYIIGQLNAPIDQLFQFIRSAQDAKISLERMNEIHSNKNEEDSNAKTKILPENGDLNLSKISFQYNGPRSPMVLKNINIFIPQGKTTAIVGKSGSGKSTLLKLLMNLYQPTDGIVRLGEVNLNNIKNRIWRNKIGVVLQDGYIFSSSIADNIGIGERDPKRKKLIRAAKIANIQSFIESLPMGYETIIGEDGFGLSQGQKQRILIARAVYKNPNYLFLDEATNSLDAYNESIIMDNIEEFAENKTMVIVAHRLSTVQNADNIIVIENGEVIEQGTHHELSMREGTYYYLVKNQFENFS